MFVVKVDISEQLRQLEDAADEIDRHAMDFLQVAAEEVLAEIEKDFEVKSRGGAGAGGVTWPRSKDGGPTGIESGEMKRRLITRRTGDVMEVLFAAPQARHFDRKRTLIPERTPSDWTEAAEDKAQPVIEQIVEDALSSLT